MNKKWNIFWMFFLLIVLVILSLSLVKDVNPAGGAILTKAFKTGTSMVLFSVFKIMLVFVMVSFVFFKMRKN